MSKWDVGSCNVIIVGYPKIHHPYEALKLLNEMQVFLCIKPNPITMAGVLHACVNLLALEQGK
jgi:hypothetical protein